MPRSIGPRGLAMIAGYDKYDQGTVCVNGHRSPRYTRNGQCVDCYDRKTLPLYRDWPVFRIRLHPDDHAEAARLLNQLKARRDPHYPL